jgi:hypothetical protein
MPARSMTLVAVFVLAMTGSNAVFAADGSHTRGAHEKTWRDARTYQLDREPAAHMPRGPHKVDDPLSSLFLG